MQFDPKRSDFTLGIIGTGAMGRGIAQVATTGGMRVLMTDARAGAAAEAKAFVAKMLERAVEKGSMSKDAHAAAVGRLEVVDGPAAMAPCHLVIEVIVEDLAAKQALFAELEGIVGADCILATNTSSLAVTTIAAKLKRPERFAGMHFFNPVPLMKLVEVIDGVRTAPEVGDALMEVGRRMGREPVRVKDAPGFIVNQVGRGFGVEAAHIAAEGIAELRRHRSHHARRRGFSHGAVRTDGADRPRREPARQRRHLRAVLSRAALSSGAADAQPLRGRHLRAQDQQGLLRLRRGQGGGAGRSRRRRRRGRRASGSASAEPDGHAALTALLKTLNAPLESGAKPSAQALILVTPYGDDATTCAVEQGLDAKRTVAVDTLFPHGQAAHHHDHAGDRSGLPRCGAGPARERRRAGDA